MILKNSYKDVIPYELVRNETNIQQGDIFTLDKEKIKELFDLSVYDKYDDPIENFIVVSNSCDIENDSIDFLSIAPSVELNFVIDILIKQMVTKKKKDGNFYSNKEIKSFVKNIIHNLVLYGSKKFFYLPKNQDYSVNNDCIVHLDIILIDNLKQIRPLILKNRICTLKNPWKEKLGWAMGNMYNRVALENYPNDLEKNLLDCIKQNCEFYKRK